MEHGGGLGHPFSRLDPGGKPPAIAWKDAPFRRVLQLFRGYVGQLIWIIALAAFASLIALGPPLVLMELVDRAIPAKATAYFMVLIGLLVFLPMCSGLVGVYQNYLNNKVSEGVMRDLRVALFANLQRQSISFFTSSKSGELVQRLTGDVQTVQDVLSRLIVSGVTQSVIVVSSIVVLIVLDWKLALLSLCIVPWFLIPVRIVSRKRRQLRGETQAKRAEMSAQISEMFGVSGALLTRLFNGESRQRKIFSDVNERVMTLELRLQLIGRWFLMLVGVLAPFGTALVYWYGGFGVMNGTMTIGEIIAFTAYLTRLYQPISQLMNLHVETATAMAVFQRIFSYLDMKPSIVDAPDAIALGESAVLGKIECKAVWFAYKEEKWVLRDVSLTADAGSTLALVGPSGAGKTTLLSLIPRLFDPQRGEILLDGEPIHKFKLEDLRGVMATVTQESFLWHASIRENLRFAAPEASDEQLLNAIETANLGEWFRGLNDGLDTVVGERGHRLSGGERQRMAIARAMLVRPKILLLDEATAHLDAESEKAVQEALSRLMSSCTTIVIAHRLSTILAADKICVLDEGRLVEQGTHSELLESSGLYAKLYETQFKQLRAT